MHHDLTHGPQFLRDGSVHWQLWAPLRTQISLILDPGPGERLVAMQQRDRGWFTHTESKCQPGRRYLYELDDRQRFPDPASRWQPDGVHQPSALFDAERFAWTDADWRGVALGDLVIYELHVGAFTPEGTFAAIIDRLPDLRELGVTAIEIMPVAQFPGDRGWGYDGVYPFAVQHSYGGPRALQELVDACHRQGLAVLLDVVYNHFGPEGNYLAQYGPYFTIQYQTPWGTALNYDGRGSDGVRQFVLDNVAWWLREFHLDGLRLDAVHAIYDSSPRHLLQEIHEVATEEADRTGRQIHVIAESNRNDIRLLNPPAQGGYGLDAQWSDDFHHCVHTLLTGELEGYYVDFGDPRQLVKALQDFFVYDGCYSPFRQRRHGAPVGGLSGERFIIAIQNHDQVGNRALGERFGTLLSPSQQRFGAALLLLAPNLPLLFMGEEYGETNPFPFFCDFGDPQLVDAVRLGRAAEFSSFTWPERLPDPFAEDTFVASRLSWSWKNQPQRDGLRQLYRTLLAARRDVTALKNYEHREANWYPGTAEGMGVVELIRGNRKSLPALAAYFNCSRAWQPLPTDSHVQRASASWLPFLSSEQARFGGERSDAEWNSEDPPGLLPYEAQVFTLNERTSI